MPILQNYSSLDEKRNFFIDDDYFIINSKQQLDDFIEARKDLFTPPPEELNIVYRGVNEAKYKNYSSAQRVWNTKDISYFNSYMDMIESITIKSLKIRDNLLSNLYKGLKVSNRELAALSFLQHYGAPTPLLDWTHDIRAGLFFGTYKSSFSESANNEIDRYFSLYEINLNDNLDLLSLSKIFEINFESLLPRRRVFSFNHIKEIGLKKWFQFGLFYISDFFGAENVPVTYINSNFNIVSQKGLFIFNSDSKKSLEEVFSDKKIYIDYTSNIFVELNNLQKIKCHNIHKNLAERLNFHLKKGKLTKEIVFPKEEDVALESYSRYLRD